MSESESPQSMLGHLLKKMADTQSIAEEARKGQRKINVESGIREAQRQIGQVSISNGGDPISGKGITKSGKED